MKNLEQKRAAHALKACEKHFKTGNGADVTKTVATMVQDCGLLPALAFALENRDEAYKRVFGSIAGYMKEQDEADVKEFLNELVKCDSARLRYITSECLAYLSFLRRFANIEGKENEQTQNATS